MMRSVSGSTSAPTRRQRSHFRRLDVVGADGDDLRTRADREQHLGDVRHERDDALRRLLRRDAATKDTKNTKHTDTVLTKKLRDAS